MRTDSYAAELTAISLPCHSGKGLKTLNKRTVVRGPSLNEGKWPCFFCTGLFVSSPSEAINPQQNPSVSSFSLGMKARPCE